MVCIGEPEEDSDRETARG